MLVGWQHLERLFDRVFEVAKSQGLAPNRDMVFCILRACLDCKRPDLAYAYALEFEENGIRVSPAQRIKIEAEAGEKADFPLVCLLTVLH